MTEDDFARMFREHYPAVLGYGMRRVGADGAHDVAAETFAIAWRRLDAAPQAPLPWLLAVARRVLANELRSRERRDQLLQRVGQDSARDPQISPLTGRGREAGEAGEAGQDVCGALALLSEQDQEVIRLVAWEELDHTAAAAVLGCSATAFRVRLHRARRRLKAALGTTSTSAPPLSAQPPPTSTPAGTQRPTTTRSF